jgi:hypothetical protein
MAYWYGLFDKDTWNELLSSGANIDGFAEGKEKTINEMHPGDLLICYCRGMSTWFNAYKILSVYFSNERLYRKYITPYQVKIKLLFPQISPEYGIRVRETLDKLIFFSKLKNDMVKESHWGSYMRTQPRKMDDADGEYLINRLRVISDKFM